jgi:hypothetical protein
MTPMEMAQALQGDSPLLSGVRIVLASILSLNHFELVQHAIAERPLARVNVNATLVGLLLPVSCRSPGSGEDNIQALSLSHSLSLRPSLSLSLSLSLVSCCRSVVCFFCS